MSGNTVMNIQLRKPLLGSLLASFCLLALLIAGPVQAEQQQTFGDYEIHYNAFNSTIIPPDVAKNYDITRSRQYGAMNVSILNRSKDGKPAIKAFVTGEFKNLIGQVQTLKFQQIQEGDAVYYIADFRFNDDDIFSFTLNVQPDPNMSASTIKFSQRFYVD